jgi:uncharacterized protein (TIGR02646 family)
MIFTRSTPTTEFRDYAQYRALLRRDFQNRCAYCLIHEFFNGSEANFEIDHHRPRNGPHARPDLASTYTNLYWACRECNGNKGDRWPDATQYEDGCRFIDPCEEWGDHDLHWIFNRDGTLTALTKQGEYTEEVLILWRDTLQHRRAQSFRDQDAVAEIEAILQLATEEPRRTELERRLAEVRERLEPPVYNRPRRGDGRPARPVPENRTE